MVKRPSRGDGGMKAQRRRSVSATGQKYWQKDRQADRQTKMVTHRLMKTLLPFRSGGSFCLFLCFNQLLSTGRRNTSASWLVLNFQEPPGLSQSLPRQTGDSQHHLGTLHSQPGNKTAMLQVFFFHSPHDECVSKVFKSVYAVRFMLLLVLRQTNSGDRWQWSIVSLTLFTLPSSYM